LGAVKKSILLFFVCIFSFSLCEGQSWDWGANGTSPYSNDFGSPVATDKNGNIYATGDYEYSIVFGAYLLNTGVQNAYLVKYDSAGNVIWATQPTPGVNSSSEGISVTTDKWGNVYITGLFYDTLTFGSFKLSRSGEAAFLAKYSPSGSVIWAKQMSAAAALGYGITTDNSGNVYITGIVNTMFLVKYDSSGNRLWLEQSNTLSQYGTSVGMAVATDNIGNAYVTGTFYDTVSFGRDTLTSATNYSSFLIKYSPLGNVVWSKQSENVSSSDLAEGTAVTIDRANNIYITGFLNNIVRFGSHSLYSPSSYSVYLAKYDATGNVFWAKQSSIGWMGSALASDEHNNIYLGGVSWLNDDTLRFGNYTLTTGPWVSYASFLTKFDSSGNPICGSMLENLGYNSNFGIASDSSGNYVYMGGTFQNDTVFCGSDTLISTNNDVYSFVGRWLSCSSVVTGINNLTSTNSAVSIFPNPNTGVFTVTFSHAESVSASQPILEIYNVSGEKVSFETLKQVRGDNVINLGNEHNGVYFYRVVEESGNIIGTGKFIIEK
jgi:hypothetical protein